MWLFWVSMLVSGGVCIYIYYTWNLWTSSILLVVCRRKQGLNSNQNKGHLGSRYTCIYEVFDYLPAMITRFIDHRNIFSDGGKSTHQHFPKDSGTVPFRLFFKG